MGAMHPAEQQVHADVREYGWHVIHVGGAGPEFAYTVGLYRTFGHPEVVVLGLPGGVAHRLLNAVGAEVRAGRAFAAGSASREILERFDVAFRPVPPEAHRGRLGWAVWFYDGPAFPALQVVYPDRDGRFPWEAGVADGLRAAQPVLADQSGGAPAG
jgi:hypothetical protein